MSFLRTELKMKAPQSQNKRQKRPETKTTVLKSPKRSYMREINKTHVNHWKRQEDLTTEECRAGGRLCTLGRAMS